MGLARVLLVEDDVFIRATLSSLLSSKGFSVVGAVETADEALVIQELHDPDVLVTDLDLGPGPNGIDIAIALRNRNPQIGVIILTSFSDPRLSDPRTAPLPKGAMYFTKSKVSDTSILLSAVLQAKHRPLMSASTRRPEQSGLTETQIEILRFVSEGQTTASIAKERNVSEKSVEAALSRIYGILGLERSHELNPRVQLTRAYFRLSGKKLPNE
jgi:DNA-binding NarL/FixJ family response regulator